MTQVQTIQPQSLAPSYNAVKIDVNNPQVNAPSCGQPQAQPQQAPVTPVYDVPTKSVYDMPVQSAYAPQAQAPAAPVPPAPVIVPATTAPAAQAPAAPVPPAPQTPAAPEAAQTPAPAATPAAASAPAAAAQQVEVKAPQGSPSSSLADTVAASLTGSDLAAQEKTLEGMATTVQGNPEQAKDLLDTKVMDGLTNVIQADTSKLEGPSQQQLEIKNKIAQNKTVTDAEKAEADKVSPKEQAEMNKKYALYTTAMLQKVYGDSVEKISNSVVPMTDLPDAAVVVEQVKSNSNPAVRSAAVDALSYIQRPEYKKDLNTIFTLAQKDQDAGVQEAAKTALDKLAQIPDAAPAPAAAPAADAAPAPAAAPVADKPAEDKKQA